MDEEDERGRGTPVLGGVRCATDRCMESVCWETIGEKKAVNNERVSVPWSRRSKTQRRRPEEQQWTSAWGLGIVLETVRQCTAQESSFSIEVTSGARRYL